MAVAQARRREKFTASRMRGRKSTNQCDLNQSSSVGGGASLVSVAVGVFVFVAVGGPVVKVLVGDEVFDGVSV